MYCYLHTCYIGAVAGGESGAYVLSIVKICSCNRMILFTRLFLLCSSVPVTEICFTAIIIQRHLFRASGIIRMCYWWKVSWRFRLWVCSWGIGFVSIDTPAFHCSWESDWHVTFNQVLMTTPPRDSWLPLPHSDLSRGPRRSCYSPKHPVNL